MPTNYVLIDYENVQPKNIEILAKHPFKVFVFVGAYQTKIPLDLATAMQKFGTDGDYVQINGNGKNALDFHIACYVGRLSMQDPEGYFHIISKDTGFDPLIKHLRAKKIRVHRENDLAEIPILKISSTTNKDETISAIVKNLAGRGPSRPRKVKTLSNTINNLFTQKLSEDELADFINILRSRKYIVVNNGSVSYKLPKQPCQTTDIPFYSRMQF